MKSPSLRIALLLPAASLALISCSTMSVEEEFADFEPVIKTAEESEQDKAMRMFGGYDPEKTSAFQGKEFQFAGRDANLRSSFEKKEYTGGDHPYFKLRDQGYFSDKKAFRSKSAREGSMAASWQGEETSWFKRMFSRKESRLGGREVARKDYRLPSTPGTFTERSVYERTEYPLNIIEENDRSKKLSKGDLGSLLNSR